MVPSCQGLGLDSHLRWLFHRSLRLHPRSLTSKGIQSWMSSHACTRHPLQVLRCKSICWHWCLARNKWTLCHQSNYWHRQEPNQCLLELHSFPIVRNLSFTSRHCWLYGTMDHPLPNHYHSYPRVPYLQGQRMDSRLLLAPCLRSCKRNHRITSALHVTIPMSNLFSTRHLRQHTHWISTH